jgi:hypothetical protein
MTVPRRALPPTSLKSHRIGDTRGVLRPTLSGHVSAAKVRLRYTQRSR